MSPGIEDIDFRAIREGLAGLPRASHHGPSDTIAPHEIVVVPHHRTALDPDRALVVGNRGMGKSFWAHALADSTAREHVARSFPELATLDVVIGFHASPRDEAVAPSESAIRAALTKGCEADAIWRAVLLRAGVQTKVEAPAGFPEEGVFSEQVQWVSDNGELVDRALTALDDRCFNEGRKLVIVFDALDRLGGDWKTKRVLVRALLQRALATRSYRAIRLKLFMRRDQFEDPQLFQFPDSSKISNQRVDLTWSSVDLYTLLFSRLATNATAGGALERINEVLGLGRTVDPETRHHQLVTAIAGEFMGSNHKRGRVFTWLPLHLSDARGETSPRTFLTAWREAALKGTAPPDRALDHRSIQWGVSKASSDRVNELKEDYPWIERALAPLRGQHVPMEIDALAALWLEHQTGPAILQAAVEEDYLPPLRLSEVAGERAALDLGLLLDLAAIGIVELRANHKVNVPDIFRLAAGIKRKGVVATPKPSQRE